MFTSFAVFLSLIGVSHCAVLAHDPTTRKLLTLERNVTQLPGLISLPVAKLQNTTLLDAISGLSKRQVVDELANTRAGTLYVISLMIGSPYQEVIVQLDTGSSDLWVDPQCANAGSANSVAVCNSYPVYDPYKSSTAALTGYEMNLAYGKGSCSGHYLVDTVEIGGAVITQQEFGWAQKSDSLAQGILGLSYGVGLGTGYYNVVDQMYVQGVTASRAFSLSLGSVDTAEGSVIFGGIDTKKFYGTLEKRPIIPYSSAPDGFPRYWIYMTSVGITVPGATASKTYTASSYSQAVFLDSGGTLSRLPTSIVESIVADFPGAVLYGNGLYTVPCSAGTSNGSVDFGFGNTVIKVPYSQFIWTAGSNVCVLGVVATSGIDWVLGDTFLRAAYVVYDQDNNNLLLANAASCGSNLVPIGSGVNAVPSVTGACSAPTSSASSTANSSTSKTSSNQVTAKASVKAKAATTSSPKVSAAAKPVTTSKTSSTTTSKKSSTTSTKKPSATTTSAKKPTSTSKMTVSSSAPAQQANAKGMKLAAASQAAATTSRKTSVTSTKRALSSTTSSSRKSTKTSYTSSIRSTKTNIVTMTRSSTKRSSTTSSSRSSSRTSKPAAATTAADIRRHEHRHRSNREDRIEAKSSRHFHERH